MAFFSKVGNFLRQTSSKQISNEISSSRPSLYQAIRCMSTNKLFVGGISYSTDETSLREAFSKYGEVTEARVILDRETGRSRGFGFVSYTSGEEASSAIQALDGQDLHGRRIRVNYANDRPRGGFGGGGYGAGGGGFGGGGYGGGAGGYGAGDGGYGGGGYNYYGGGNRGGRFDNFGGGNSPSSYGSGAPSDYASSGGNEGFGDPGMGFGSAQESGGTGGFGEHFADDNSNADGNLNQDDSTEANYRDDDDNGDFAKRG